MLKSTQTLECWLLLIFGKENDYNNERCQNQNKSSEKVQHYVMSVTKGDRQPYGLWVVEDTNTNEVTSLLGG